ncbi:CHAT domain-containing tetratricopeptide repeat protein [Paraburkholderia terrae]|uniref:CHAT domain-containing tetratricopeptide repeat protein n=1 Tax=Paraburkholderia terrae TaxID=311230 RepID=UPI00296AC515|nr:CHAT domain-containing tetratricopeptide repeat protein [Paraburkholderia terrae]MDW3660577.1 CHAT domain-containing protein [Paraburkholderia terrae]
MPDAKIERVSPEGLFQRIKAGMDQRDHSEVLEALAFATALYDDERQDERNGSIALAELFQLVGFLLKSIDDPKEAKRFLERSLNVRQLLGVSEDDPSLVWALEELLALCQKVRDVPDEPRVAERLERARRKRLENLESILPSLMQAEDLQTAYEAIQEMLDLNLSLRDENKSNVATALNNLAFIEKRLGNFDAAEKHYQEAIGLWRAMDGETSRSELASGLNNLAQLRAATGDLANAESLLREAVSIVRESCRVDTTRDFPSIVSTIGEYIRGNTPEQNAKLLAGAHEMAERIGLLARLSSELALVLDRQNRHIEAHALHSFSVDLLTRLFGDHHSDTLEAIARLAKAIEGHDSRGAEDLIQGVIQSLSSSTLKFASDLHGLPSLEPLFESMMTGTPRGDVANGPENVRSLLEQTCEAFVAGEYPKCFRSALRLGSAVPCLEAMQLFLISIQYLHGTVPSVEGNQLDALARGVVELTANEKWSNLLFKLITGQTSPHEVIAAASSDEAKCQACFYAGWRALLERKREEALIYLDDCRSINVDMLERTLARRTGDPWPPSKNRGAENEVSMLNNDVATKFVRSDFIDAKVAAQTAYQKAERYLEPYSRARKQSLYHLAGIALKKSDFEGAEELLLLLLPTLMKKSGMDAKLLSGSLNLKGLLRTEQGRFRDAEQCFNEAIDSIDVVGLRHDAQTAQVFGNLAEVKREQRDFPAALPLYEKVLEYLPATDETVRLERARWLNNVALLYLSNGQSDAAVPLLEEALQVRTTTLAAMHPDIARTKAALAHAACMDGRYGDAERLLAENVDIYRSAYGADSIHEALALNSLAMARISHGGTTSEPLLTHAISIIEGLMGSHHPILATLWTNLSLVRWFNGNVQGAMECLGLAEPSQKHLIREVFGSNSERQRFVFARETRRRSQLAVALAVDALLDPTMVKAAFDHVLQTEGLAFDAQAVQRDVALGIRHPELREDANRLRAVRARLSTLAMSGPGAEGIGFHRRLLEKLQGEHDRLEATLASQIPELGESTEWCDCERLAATLPRHCALIDYVQYIRLQKEQFLGDPVDRAERGVIRYAAFVLRAGDPNPRLVDIGTVAQVNGLLATFRSTITGERELDEVLGSEYGDLQEQVPWIAMGAALRRAVFDPILFHLDGCKNVFLVPDGDLCRLPFEALPIEDSRFVIDDFDVCYLGAGRDLLKNAVARRSSTNPAIVIADPNFDLVQQPITTHESYLRGSVRSGGLEVDPDNRLSTRRSRGMKDNFLYFSPLPGTAVEGREVANMLGVTPFVSDLALERAVRDSTSPAILHIATHGFFLPNQGSDLTLFDDPAMSYDGEDIVPQGENPLLRSGLALAGANSWLADTALPSDAGDGLLTAEDVATLNLIDTQLVVLSACDTGIGEIEAGEGVLGLRRSFKLAGAQTLVMSLWKVPDAETAELMQEFYRHLLCGMNCANALRLARLTLKSRQANPYYWGAFVCDGNPAPINLDLGNEVST